MLEAFFKFAELYGTPISQYQGINIAYVIIHNTGQFSLVVCEYNRKTQNLKTWIKFRSCFRTSHAELISTTALMDQYSGVKHSNMVLDVVAIVQEYLAMHVPTETTAPIKTITDTTQVTNAITSSNTTQRQILHQMQKIIQSM